MVEVERLRGWLGSGFLRERQQVALILDCAHDPVEASNGFGGIIAGLSVMDHLKQGGITSPLEGASSRQLVVKCEFTLILSETVLGGDVHILPELGFLSFGQGNAPNAAHDRGGAFQTWHLGHLQHLLGHLVAVVGYWDTRMRRSGARNTITINAMVWPINVVSHCRLR